MKETSFDEKKFANQTIAGWTERVGTLLLSFQVFTNDSVTWEPSKSSKRLVYCAHTSIKFGASVGACVIAKQIQVHKTHKLIYNPLDSP